MPCVGTVTLHGRKAKKKKGRECRPLIDRNISKEFLTANILLVVIGFQWSLLKGISAEKQLDVKRKELSECSGFKNNVGYALGLRIKRMMSK